VKNVARYQDEIRLQLDDLVDHSPHRCGNVGLALVDAGGSLTLVLAEAEVYVGEVYESHRLRIALIHCVIFVRTCIGAPCGSPFRPATAAMVDLTMMLLFESVIQPRRRSIWMLPLSVPEVAYPAPGAGGLGALTRDMVPRIEM
jgi:hypothetical protein